MPELADAPALVRLSTDDLHGAGKLQYWTEAISHAFFGMSVDASDKQAFRSFANIAPLDALLVAHVGGSRRVACRSAGHIRHAADHAYNLSVDFSNAWVFDSSSGTVRLEPGDAVLADLRLVHSTRYLEDASTPRLNVKMPAHWLANWVRDPDPLAGIRIGARSGWGRALSTFLKQLSPETAVRATVPPQLLADQLGSLLSLVEAERSAVPGDGPADSELTAKIREVLRSRYAQTSLTAADVALSLGVSRRTLHRHLTSANTTFGSLLQEIRVAEARRMLEAPSLSSLTVSEIGFRAGFGDPSHFVRVVRARLEESPAAYRRSFAGQARPGPRV